MSYKTIQDTIGNTPLVQLVRLPGADAAARNNIILGKMEGDNPAGSVKDRAALSMLKRAEERGDIKPGDTLIEATSGNTGIALAMVAAVRGYKMVLLMPDNLSVERRQSMAAYGAQIVLTPKTGGMEYARDMAEQMQREGKGLILDQFGNGDNPRAHYETTGPEIWRDTEGRVTHFVSAMGTTGTIMGVSQYLKEQNEAIRIIGAQPEEGSSIPGIRKWPEAYLPKIFDKARVDQIESVSQAQAEHMARRMAAEEGIFCGISAAGACEIALRISQAVEKATIDLIVCDRGDRYLSTGVFPAYPGGVDWHFLPVLVFGPRPNPGDRQRGPVPCHNKMPTPVTRKSASVNSPHPRSIRRARPLRLWLAFFWLELLVADAEFVAAVAHQIAQIADRQVAHFVHADQQRGADGQAVVADLGDDRWRHFQGARQGRVIFQAQVFDQRVEQPVRVVLQQIVRIRIAVHINADLVCHFRSFLFELCHWFIDSAFALLQPCNFKLSAMVSENTLENIYTIVQEFPM